MNKEYDNNMSGVLFKNDRKEKDTHPDYKGHCEVDGVEMWLSAWIKEGNKGKFMRLSFQPKQPLPEAATRSPVGNSGTGFDCMDDDIPF